METALEWIESGGLWAVVVTIALEYACFPLPSEVLLPLVGALCAKGGIGFGVIYGFSILAGLAGCSFCYWLSRWGGGRFLDWLMRKVPKSRRGIEASQDFFSRYAHLAVCLGRMIPVCRTYISFIAGCGGQKYGGFLFFSLLGIACWNMLLLSAGFFLGDNWSLTVVFYDRFKWAVVIIGALVLMFFLLKRYRWGKKMRNRW